MKRYIKSSFGYEDRDWINPPESGYDEDSDQIEIVFEDDKLNFISDEWSIPKLESLPEWFDTEDGVVIAYRDEIIDIVFDALTPYLPEDDGNYLISGIVSIPYTAWVPYKGSMPRRDWEEKLESAEVEIHKPEVDNIQIKSAK